MFINRTDIDAVKCNGNANKKKNIQRNKYNHNFLRLYSYFHIIFMNEIEMNSKSAFALG